MTRKYVASERFAMLLPVALEGEEKPMKTLPLMIKGLDI
jgi:hypothetical protein